MLCYIYLSNTHGRVRVFCFSDKGCHCGLTHVVTYSNGQYQKYNNCIIERYIINSYGHIQRREWTYCTPIAGWFCP